MGVGKWRSRLYKTDRARDFDHERDRQVRARQVYETIDRQPYQWIVVLVAGIGFFLDGYTLFATNIALPMIAYVYWPDELTPHKQASINTATLAGTLIGQLIFGVLADKRGRKKMYGVELIVLLTSTLGATMASTGSHNSMSIFAWLIVWRVAAGIAVGADYPLSAIITSEFAPTTQRARMLATIFFMQPLGQMFSNIAAMVVIELTRRTLGDSDPVRAVDIMWRWIIGIGVFPGVLAILFRLAIPETPRFTLEIQDDPVKAEFDATHLFGEIDEEQNDSISPIDKELESGTWSFDPNPTNHASSSHQRPAASIMSNISTTLTFYCDESHPTSLPPTNWTTLTPPTLPTLNSKWSLTKADIYQFFIKERNGVTLLCTSLSWLLLDFGFYGIGLSSPQFLAKTWGSLNISGRRPPWQITDDPNTSIYDTFLQTSFHGLLILNLGSVLGSGLLILTINKLNRVHLQRYTFLALAALFVAIACVFLVGPQSYREGPLAISLYVLGQVIFNFGPNATTFILPAELFPTRYRATCHGISAASGKFGSILMQIVRATSHHHGPLPPGQKFDPSKLANKYGKVVIGFSAAMLLGFVVSFGIPNVQVRDGEAKDEKKGFRNCVARLGGRRGKLRSRTLEELSLGRMGVRSSSVARTMRSVY